SDFTVAFLHNRRENQRNNDHQSNQMSDGEYDNAKKQRAQRLAGICQRSIALDNPDPRQLGDGEFNLFYLRARGKLQQKCRNTIERHIRLASISIGIGLNTLRRWTFACIDRVWRLSASLRSQHVVRRVDGCERFKAQKIGLVERTNSRLFES